MFKPALNDTIALKVTDVRLKLHHPEGGGGIDNGFQPIIKSLQIQFEAELGCDNLIKRCFA